MIQLKFGENLSGPKANTCINFSANPVKIYGVTRCITRKSKWNFCHAYRISRLLKHNENQHVARMNIKGVPFVGYKVRDNKDIKLILILVKIA